MARLSKRGRECASRLHLTCTRSSMWFAVRCPDLLILPWFLEGAVHSSYLLARMTSLIIPFVLHALSTRVTVHLEELSQSDNPVHLQAAAARVNLGYLMVCGATALLVLNFAPYLSAFLGDVAPAFSTILTWLVIGQSAPILFGATSLLMHVSERGLIYRLIHGATACFFVGSILAIGEGSAIIVAQSLAAAQLTHAAICAAVLVKHGVWPGLTALFHKEIKLF